MEIVDFFRFPVTEPVESNLFKLTESDLHSSLNLSDNSKVKHALIALFDSSATLGASTTAYATSEEITGTGYTAGGKTITSVTPVLDSSTAVCDFGDVSWTSATFTANACLIYNSSASNKAVCSVAFGGDKSVSSGTFTIQFPAAAATTAIVRIA